MLLSKDSTGSPKGATSPYTVEYNTVVKTNGAADTDGGRLSHMQVMLESDSVTSWEHTDSIQNKVTHWSGTLTFLLKLEETQENTREIAQLVKCLLHEHKNLRLSPEHTFKDGGGG